MTKIKSTSARDNTKAKKNSAPRSVAQLCGAILPENFRSRSALISQFQHFFNGLESDAVFQMVKVLNVENNVLTLALPSPALLNYLRLHSQELRVKIEEQFGQVMQLKFTIMPSGSYTFKDQDRLPPATHFSAEVSNKIKRSAQDVDDDELMQSLMDLADAIRRRDD